MRVSLLFPNAYLSADDFRGADVTMTIARLTVEDLRTNGGSTEKKPCLYFVEIEDKHKRGRMDDNKKLVLNKTNAKTIAAMYGNETDDWVGKRITLYPTTTKFGRDTVDCIRVRPSKPRAAQARKQNREPDEPNICADCNGPFDGPGDYCKICKDNQ